MFVPMHNAIGCLQYSVGVSDNIVYPDAALYQRIEDGIAGGNWTYLRIGMAPSCEIVRVHAANMGALTVDRGIDGTGPLPFGALAPLVYVATAASVEDQMQSVPGNDVQISANAPLQIQHDSVNEFVLSLPEPNFTSDDDSVLVTGQYPNYNIATNKKANGCC